MSEYFTKDHQDALKWLSLHSGDGVFARNGVAVREVEAGPIALAIYYDLCELGMMMEFVDPTGKGHLRMTARGEICRIFGPDFFFSHEPQ